MERREERDPRPRRVTLPVVAGHQLVAYFHFQGFFRVVDPSSPGTVTLARRSAPDDFARWVTIDEPLQRLTERYIRRALQKAGLDWDDFIKFILGVES